MGSLISRYSPGFIAPAFTRIPKSWRRTHHSEPRLRSPVAGANHHHPFAAPNRTNRGTEERIKNGTEDDPEFQARWNVDDGTRVRSVVVVLERTFGNASDQRNTCQLVLASSHEAAVESVAHFRTDVQRIICTDYESAMRVIRDQMDLGAWVLSLP